MHVPKETQKKIDQLSMMEENLRKLSFQRQNLSSEQLEIQNAEKELAETEGTVYKIIGPVMVTSSKEKILKEIQDKKEMIELQIKSIEKQEGNLKEKSKEIQDSILAEMENKDGSGNNQ